MTIVWAFFTKNYKISTWFIEKKVSISFFINELLLQKINKLNNERLFQVLNKQIKTRQAGI